MGELLRENILMNYLHSFLYAIMLSKVKNLKTKNLKYLNKSPCLNVNV